MRRLMFRGEILDEVGNSWFTAKSIKVEPWGEEREKVKKERRS